MTLTEMLTEWEYRKEERLGILCGQDKPTAEQLKMAEGDASRWLREFSAPKKEVSMPYKD